MARVFIAVDSDLGVVGFYSLSAFKLDLDDLPEEIVRKLPRYDDGVPAALIGRLARDAHARQGPRRSLGGGCGAPDPWRCQALAVLAIVVDAKDERAAAFYEGLGFRRFPLRPNRLFLLASSAVTALERM